MSLYNILPFKKSITNSKSFLFLGNIIFFVFSFIFRGIFLLCAIWINALFYMIMLRRHQIMMLTILFNWASSFCKWVMRHCVTYIMWSYMGIIKAISELVSKYWLLSVLVSRCNNPSVGSGVPRGICLTDKPFLCCNTSFVYYQGKKNNEEESFWQASSDSK